MNTLVYYLGPSPLWRGGLTVYSESLIREGYRTGNKVIGLIPFHYKSKKNNYFKFFRSYNNCCHYTFNYNFLNYFKKPDINSNASLDEKKLLFDSIEFLKNLSIEIILIQTLIGLHTEFIQAAKLLGIKIVFTAHDYTGICIKSTLFDYNTKNCNDFNNGISCQICNTRTDLNISNNLVRNLFIKYPLLSYCEPILAFYKFFKVINVLNVSKFKITKIDESELKLSAKDYIMYRNYHNKLISKFSYIIFNSYKTKQIFSRYFNFSNIPNSVEHLSHYKVVKKNTKDDKVKPINNKLVLGYLGSSDPSKGLSNLISILKKDFFVNRDDWQLKVYSRVNKENIKNVSWCGPFKPKHLKRIFSKIDLLVFPSVLNETFGFVGLESISFNTPVLVSDSSGFSELITNNVNGFVFSYTTPDNTLEMYLKKILNNPKIITNTKRNLIKSNPTIYFANHYDRLNKIYNSINTKNLQSN